LAAPSNRDEESINLRAKRIHIPLGTIYIGVIWDTKEEPDRAANTRPHRNHSAILLVTVAVSLWNKSGNATTPRGQLFYFVIFVKKEL
jgi:hypothetical protein